VTVGCGERATRERTLKIAIMGSGGIGGYYAQRVEVDAKEVRIMGSKSVLLRTLVAASRAKTAGFGVPSFVPKWRATADEDGHYAFAVAL
jgi:homoserine dehydrogenase